MKTLRHARQFRLAAEQLEKRELLAANVCSVGNSFAMGPWGSPGEDGPGAPTQLESQLQTRLQNQNRLVENSDMPRQQQRQENECIGDGDGTRIQLRERNRAEGGGQLNRERNRACDSDPAGATQARAQSQRRLSESEETPLRRRDRTSDGGDNFDRDRQRHRDQTCQNDELSVVSAAKAVTAGEEASSLEIQVAPQVLVLFSKGGNLTVHTNVPYSQDFVAQGSIALFIDGTEMSGEDIQWATFPDANGNLVIQCSKDDVKGLITVGEDGTTPSTLVVELTIDGETASETIPIKS